jgi:radical SAM superfamily enzyme YgiQ (UPF0313 family)
MKILLISPNVESLPDPVFPIGLAYISGALKGSGDHCRVLDLCFAEDYASALVSEIKRFQPDVAGLSLRNLDNVSYPNYASYLSFYRQVVRTVRKHSKASIVVGGSGFSLMPEAVLQYLEADVGIAGEGERSFLRFIDHMAGRDDTLRIPESRIIDAGTGIIEDLDEIPRPDRRSFDGQAYLKWGGMGNLQTKRGCPFGCVYCTYPIIEGKTVRTRDPVQVCDEIEEMLEAGIDSFFVVDNEFNYPLAHAEAVCREMMLRKLPIRWSCYANPKFVTPGLLDLMISAGCTGLEFGSDAASDLMLARLGKNFVVSDLKEASSWCRRAGIPFCHSLLLGGPGETMETVRETLDAVGDMSPTAVICMIGIRIFPNTELARMAAEEGRIQEHEDFLNPVFYLSEAVEDKVVPFMEAFSRENPTWIFPGLNINMTVALQRKLRRFGIKGPLWEYMEMGKRFGRKRALSARGDSP